MNNELYGEYKEFTEVDMTLQKLVYTGIDEAIDKAVAKERKGLDKAIDKAVANEREKLNRTVKAMKAGGEAINKIMRYTGLSRREIMAL